MTWTHLLMLVIGLMFGGSLGVVLAALACAAGRGEE